MTTTKQTTETAPRPSGCSKHPVEFPGCSDCGPFAAAIRASQPGRRRYPADATPGFGCKISEDTELGLATLIVEDQADNYEPVAVVSSIAEGREIAASDLRARRSHINKGNAGLIPYQYKIWARGIDGRYLEVKAFDRASL